LLPELRDSQGSDEKPFDEILDRWESSYQDGAGLLARLRDEQLSSDCPEWLGQLADDIRTAAYELGYLHAGRTISESDNDPVTEGVESAFQGLKQ